MGYDASKVILAMMTFGDARLFPPGKEPIQLFDRRTNRRVTPEVVDAATKQPLDARQLYAGPGPGFRAPLAVKRARFRDYYDRTDPASPRQS